MAASKSFTVPFAYARYIATAIDRATADVRRDMEFRQHAADDPTWCAEHRAILTPIPEADVDAIDGTATITLAAETTLTKAA